MPFARAIFWGRRPLLMVDWIIRKISANGCQKWILKKPYIIYVFLYMAKWKKNRKWVNHQEYQPGWQVNGKKTDFHSANPLTNGSHRAPPAPGKLCGWGRQGPTRSPDGFAGVAKKNAGWISDTYKVGCIRHLSKPNPFAVPAPPSGDGWTACFPSLSLSLVFFSRRSQQKWYIQ